ncbi:MAG: hypothetical protein HYV18_05720, partial [Gammaproteobacteria bacterium]|nr:hypothetical protein [Gammaproteobacteria bacterium]
MNKHIVLVAVIAGLAVAGCSSRAKRSTSSPAESETTSASSESVYTAPEPATAPRAP